MDEEEIGGCFLRSHGVFRMELAANCNYMICSEANLSLKLRQEGSSAATRDCDTGK